MTHNRCTVRDTIFDLYVTIRFVTFESGVSWNRLPPPPIIFVFIFPSMSLFTILPFHVPQSSHVVVLIDPDTPVPTFLFLVEYILVYLSTSIFVSLLWTFSLTRDSSEPPISLEHVTLCVFSVVPFTQHSCVFSSSVPMSIRPQFNKSKNIRSNSLIGFTLPFVISRNTPPHCPRLSVHNCY